MGERRKLLVVVICVDGERMGKGEISRCTGYWVVNVMGRCFDGGDCDGVAIRWR